MAYRIVYGPVKGRRRTGRGAVLRMQTMTAAWLLVFALVVSWVWPEGTATLREYLLPGRDGTQAAMLELMTEIQAGEPVGEVLTAFCRQIIENGKSH